MSKISNISVSESRSESPNKVSIKYVFSDGTGGTIRFSQLGNGEDVIMVDGHGPGRLSVCVFGGATNVHKERDTDRRDDKFTVDPSNVTQMKEKSNGRRIMTTMIDE